MKNAWLGWNACHSGLPKSGSLHIGPEQEDRRPRIVRLAQGLAAASVIVLAVAFSAATPRPAFAVICDNSVGEGPDPAGTDGGAAVNTACGTLATASAANSGQTAIGFRTTGAGATDAVALGDTTSAGATSSIAIGADSTIAGPD